MMTDIVVERVRLFMYLISSYILPLGKAQINLALLSTYSYI